MVTGIYKINKCPECGSTQKPRSSGKGQKVVHTKDVCGFCKEGLRGQNKVAYMIDDKACFEKISHCGKKHLDIKKALKRMHERRGENPDGSINKEVLNKMAKVLTSRGRKRIKEKNFALPGGRYPIHDRVHARAALSMVAKHGTPEEQAIVRSKVKAKYPGIGKKAEEIYNEAFNDELEKIAFKAPYGDASRASKKKLNISELINEELKGSSKDLGLSKKHKSTLFD